MRREDYLGCRVSERRFESSPEIADGLGLSHREHRPTTPADNGTTATFEEVVADIFREAREILLSKHQDYGPTNIANAPGGALNGLRVRIHDKTARINHLIDNLKYKNPQHESLRDSFLDLMNYAAIALLVIDGNWPGIDDDTEADCG